MATKSSDLLNRLPSISELLERPPLRALADRWNRSVVAAGVKSFIDELQSDLQRRTAHMQFPSLRELAERAARHVVRMQEPSARPAINATGRLLAPPWASYPLADEALERLVAMGSGFVYQHDPRAAGSAIGGDVAAALCRLTGAEAATTVHSYAGAICITLAALAEGREVAVSRSELGDVEPGCSPIALAASASTVVTEVGSTNRTEIADYEAAITERTAALLKHTPDGYRMIGQCACAELEELVALARDRELPLIHALGAAPLVDGLPVIGNSIRSVAASLEAGVQLVIVRGDGLLGGPRCGIVIGNRELIGRIECHPLFAAWQVAPSVAAALRATLELYDDRTRMQQAIPLFQLLSASVENLRQRAERLAPQLAQAEQIAAAEPLPTENDLGIANWGEPMLASFGVSLLAADGNVTTLDERLRAGPVPIVGRLEGDRLMLDLRTVFPRQDQSLVEIIVSGPTAGTRVATLESAAQC